MLALFSNPHLRNQLVLRGVEGALLLGVLVGAVLGYRFVHEARLAIAQEESALSAEPQYFLALSTLQEELRGRNRDIERIVQLALAPNDIVAFIDTVEKMAGARHLQLKVSDIGEVELRNDIGEVIPQTGPFRSIHLTIKGQGEGRDLVEFVHELEYSPYLVTLPHWRVSYDPAAAIAAQQADAAREIDAVAAGKSAPPAPVELTAEILLLVHNEKYSP